MVYFKYFFFKNLNKEESEVFDQLNKKIGTVIAYINEPNVNQFRFVLTEENNKNKKIPIRKGQFIELSTDDGKIIAMVMEIYKTNRYFSRAESVREYEKTYGIQSIFPTEKWEHIIAIAKPLCKFNEFINEKDNSNKSTNFKLDRVSFPPSPGDYVYLASDDILNFLLGLKKTDGLNLGKIRYHENIDAKLDLTRFIQKHIAILAMSGAGKSYTTSVLIEELLNRDPSFGRIGVVIIDVHGEYASLCEKPNKNTGYKDFSELVKVIKSPYMTINTSYISGYQFGDYQPNMSPAQIRELNRIISEYRRKNPNMSYSLRDLIDYITADDQMNQRSKEAMLGWLDSLDYLHIFSDEENPKIEESVRPGRALIFDLSETISIKHKQILVAYFAERLFNLRKEKRICPFILIIEEAHQFCPEGKSISKRIIETYAREGRKFGASLCLISQRPVKLSTTALSQCGTHIIMRITNPSDLDHIKKSSEQITSETLGLISNLPIGEALIVGNAVNFPIFVKVREKCSNTGERFLKLEEEAKIWEKKYSK